jgi:peroxiredoxin
MTRKPLLLMLAVLLTGPLACAHRATPPAELPATSGPLLGLKAPDLQGTTVEGARFVGASGNRAMVVYFFDSSSARSRRPLRALQELALSRADEVVVVGISRDADARSARSLATEYDLTFPILHDAGGALARRFQVSQPTAVFVVSSYGQIEWTAQGEQHHEVIGQAALSVLAGSTRAVAAK